MSMHECIICVLETWTDGWEWRGVHENKTICFEFWKYEAVKELAFTRHVVSSWQDIYQNENFKSRVLFENAPFMLHYIFKLSFMSDD